MVSEPETITFTSEDARNKWGDIMRAVLSGKRILITRYGMPFAEMLPFFRPANGRRAAEPPAEPERRP